MSTTGASGRQQVLLVILLTVIAVAVLLGVLIFPKLAGVRIARQRAVRLEQEVGRTAALVQAQPQVEQRLLAARRSMQNLLVRVPEGPQVPGLVAQLDDAVVISGVRLVQISFTTVEQAGEPGASQVQAGIGTTGLSVQVRGSYPQVRRFVTSIEASPRAMTVDRVALTASEGGIFADLTIRAFHLR